MTTAAEDQLRRDHAALEEQVRRIGQGLREGRYAYALDKTQSARDALDSLVFALRWYAPQGRLLHR